jgi:hypothetical protein
MVTQRVFLGIGWIPGISVRFLETGVTTPPTMLQKCLP